MQKADFAALTLQSLNNSISKLFAALLVTKFSSVLHRHSARSIQSPFWPAGGSPARDRRTAVLFPIEWNRRNKSADLEKESTAHYKVMQKLVKSAVFLYIFCEKSAVFYTFLIFGKFLPFYATETRIFCKKMPKFTFRFF